MSDEREQRNQVFSAGAPAIDPRIPSISAADKVKADFGLDVPVEVVPLPSSGLVYPASSALHGLETVEIKAMTAREEDILTNSAYLKKGTVITELIRSCLMDRSVNPIDMLTGDRNALMVAIRVTGYGAEYDAEVECSECGVKASRPFNLAELAIKRLEIQPVELGTNVFEFQLPKAKNVVRFKFLTGRDEEEIMVTGQKQKKAGLQDGAASVTTNLLYSIVAVDGKTDRAQIAGFVRQMPAIDSLALRNYIRQNEPGINMRQQVECPACDHAEEVSMPIGVTFLWPGTAR